MSRGRVLVVDDNLLNLKLARVVLEAAGHEVRTATDAASALAVLGEFGAAVILMDIGLPKISGLDLTRHLRADPAHAGIAILAVSASAMPEDVRRAYDAGCDGYVAKPIDTEVLLAEVAAWLGRSRAALP